MTLVENQSAHRIAMEAQIIPRQVDENRRGQTLAGCVAFTALVLTGWLGYLHETAAACTVGGAIVVSLAASFLGGKAAILKSLITKRPSKMEPTAASAEKPGALPQVAAPSDGMLPGFSGGKD